MIWTERLVLEPLQLEHAGEMVDVLADPALYEFTGGSPPSLAELMERYRLQAVGRSPDRSEEWRSWIVRSAEDGRAIGFVQATIVDGRADVAWLIGVAWQGQGFATEAVHALVGWLETREDVGVITAHIGPGHRASAVVASRAGLSPTDEIEDGEIVWRNSGRSAG